MITSSHILLFDGVCNLCNSLVRFIIKKDRDAKIKFTPLQSVSGNSLLKKINISASVTDSVIYITGDEFFLKSSALLHLLKDLGGVWKLFYGFIIIPLFIRDFFYNIIAKNRYKIFGKTDKCMVPASDHRERFVL